ncbi:MAG: hypothetical protein ACOY90_16630 [Candidatus Zhuqueibacterota bacterium]
MELIPRKTVDEIWMRIGRSTVTELNAIEENFKKEQPYIHEFVEKFNQHLNPELAELTNNYTRTIWAIFRSTFPHAQSEISTNQILDIVEKRELWLDKFDEFDIEKSYNFIEKQPEIKQIGVISYALDMLIEDIADNYALNKQDEAYLFWLLIVLVEIFDQTKL